MKFPLFNVSPGQLARVIEAQAKANPGLQYVRISPYDYRKAGWDRNGPATAIAILPEPSLTFDPPSLAELEPIRRVYVEPDSAVEPGSGESP